MIYVQSIVGLSLLVVTVIMARAGWAAGLLGGAMFAIWFTMFLDWARFNMPMKWRARSKRWDAFLCRVGSHRCVPICGTRCCWVCIRCSPDDPGVKRHFEMIARMSR